MQQQTQTKQVTVTDVTDDWKSEEREETKEVINSFLTRESRNTFIVRVYSILTVQLLLVALSVLLFGKYPMLNRWMLTGGKFGKCVYVFHAGPSYLLLFEEMHFSLTITHHHPSTIILFVCSSMGIFNHFYHYSNVHDHL